MPHPTGRQAVRIFGGLRKPRTAGPPVRHERGAIAEPDGVWETGLPRTESQMIRLFLSDGRRIHVNPVAIAYLEQLPEPKEGDKEQPRTKIVLMTGDSVLVRQGPGQILVAAGYATSKKDQEPAKESEADAEDD